MSIPYSYVLSLLLGKTLGTFAFGLCFKLPSTDLIAFSIPGKNILFQVDSNCWISLE